MRYHGQLELRTAGPRARCSWLVITSEFQQLAAMALDMRQWELVATVRRPTDPKENVLLYRLRRQR
jgi:hypothetical protein